MLKFMREQMGKTFLVIIVGGISMVFVLSGVFSDRLGMGGSATGSTVATVGGEKISARQLQQAVNQEMESYRSLGMDLPPELAENVRRGTLESLVQSKLMLVEARRVGIQASDREVTEEIQRLPYFQDPEKKVFSVELYKKVLSTNNLNPAQFEDDVRQSLTHQRMQKFLSDRIRVTPAEVEREFKISNDTRNLYFKRFTREDAMKKISIAPEALDAFLKDASRENQIAGFYATNNVRYNQPEKVCARHILKRADKSADPNAKAPKEFLALNPTPGNFAALAKKQSEDPGSKDKGGDLDCFGKGMMDKAFEEVAFKLPVGKVSEPVRSAFGWHYILVTKKVPPVNQPLEKVKREIALELMRREKIEEIRKINLASAEEAAKNWTNAGADTTGAFNSLEGVIPKIGRADEILKAAFDPKAKIQSGPQVFESQGGVIVAKIMEKKSPDLSKFEKEKDMHIRTLRERKLRAFLPAWMENVRARTKISFNSALLNQM